MDKFYRNQTPAISAIQAISKIRITNPQDAVAFIRTVQPIYEQIASVLLKESLFRQHHANKVAFAAAPQPEPVQEVKPVEAPKTFVPEDLTTDEGFSEAEIEEKVSKLKASRAKKAKEE